MHVLVSTLVFNQDPKERRVIIIFTVRTLNIGTEQIIPTSKNLLSETPRNDLEMILSVGEKSFWVKVTKSRNRTFALKKTATLMTSDSSARLRKIFHSLPPSFFPFGHNFFPAQIHCFTHVFLLPLECFFFKMQLILLSSVKITEMNFMVYVMNARLLMQSI